MTHDDDDDIDTRQDATQPQPEPQNALALEAAAELRAVNAAFTSALPRAAAAGGSYDMAAAQEFAEDHATDAGLLPVPVLPAITNVPDGKYRVDGSDWIMTIAGNAPVLFERGGPTTDPTTYEAVPTA